MVFKWLPFVSHLKEPGSRRSLEVVQRTPDALFHLLGHVWHGQLLADVVLFPAGDEGQLEAGWGGLHRGTVEVSASGGRQDVVGFAIKRIELNGFKMVTK